MKHYKLWTVPVTVADDFVDDQSLLQQLRSDSPVTAPVVGLNATIQCLDTKQLTPAQQKILSLVTGAVANYCVENSMDYSRLEFSNFVRSYVYEYTQDSVSNNSYEPHHDMVEGNFITACFYLDSAWDGKTWCGGELAIYREFTFITYPSNSINLEPRPNRLAIFPGFVPHRVKPYFGKTPRINLVFAWSLPDAVDCAPTII